jgi:hypothetical protein
MANLAIKINSKSEFETVKKHNIECGYQPDECYDTLYYPEYKYFTFGDAWVTCGLKFLEDNNFEVISFQSFLTLTGIQKEDIVKVGQSNHAIILQDKVFIENEFNVVIITISKDEITEIFKAIMEINHGG